MIRNQLRRPARPAASKPMDQSTVIKRLVLASRESGKLNLSSQSLAVLPDLLFDDQDLTDQCFDRATNWWQRVDLVRLLAADNELEELSPRLCELGGLVLLDFHNNKISLIPVQLQSLEHLQVLNLASNQIKDFPRELCHLPLLELHLGGNQIESLPVEIGALSRLAVLDLAHNQLRDLPFTLSELSNLQTLNVSHNRLRSLKGIDFSALALLTTLRANNNQMESFTDKSLDLPRLVILDVKYNAFRSWDTVLQCPKLCEFCCAFNRISTVEPGSFSSCSLLEIFDIRDNNIGSVPVDVLGMYRLKRLDITNNSVSQLPPELSLLKSLVTVHHAGNPLRGLPSSGGTVRLLDYLSKKLVFSSDDPLTSAPQPELSAGAGSKTIEWVGLNLQNLDLKDAKPSQLNLAQNQLSALPKDFAQTSQHLTTLNLSKNKFVSFPLLACEQLVTLDLSCNLLVSFPPVFPHLPHLNELNLNNNRLSQFPSSLPPSLCVLLFASNHLSAIDMSVLRELLQLQVLDLSNNSIASVPPELGLLKLNNLQLNGNCFKVPRLAIIQKGTNAILEYLKSRIVQ
ncbi:Leucine-rich repeat-containing protein 40 [Kappamyces sp. JEL0829]|nr:Leucine-rich repeat-containing protein 40 [Kappamyces sp. JEL0829]